ncbi:MAG TPA: TonB-dependent receptor, partial [Longimicrobiales bacterium]|nr:TonB-dependent receptor [Longimicrobiales bacterium]
VVGFHHALSDAIVRIALPDGRFQRVNRDEQTGTGVELLAGYRTGEFSLSGDVVMQRTKLQDPAAGVSLTPEYQPEVLAGLAAAGPLPLQARFDVRARHVGRQYCINPDTGAETPLPSARRFDAEVSRRWQVGRGWMSLLELAVAADNFTDALTYDQCGLPQPGRTLRFQLRLR